MKTKHSSGLSGHTLKLIALCTMFLDHIGAVLLERGLLPRIANAVLAGNSYDYVVSDYHFWYSLNLILRYIGRIAFPLYCFLLVEGFFHTKNVASYALRLGIFALISEVPFDLALYNSFFELKSQNVFFTLFIGLIVLWCMRYFEALPPQLAPCRYLVALTGMMIAKFLQTDYSAFGVLLIVLLYSLRYNRKLQCISGAVITFLHNYTGALAFLLAGYYNEERGNQLPKYVFYVFYPAHLLFLFGIRMLMLT